MYADKCRQSSQWSSLNHYYSKFAIRVRRSSELGEMELIHSLYIINTTIAIIIIIITTIIIIITVIIITIIISTCVSF